MIYDKSPWVHTLTPEELEERWDLCRSLDPAHTRDARQWWEQRTLAQLAALEHDAWNACDKDAYQLARTYKAERLAEVMA